MIAIDPVMGLLILIIQPLIMFISKKMVKRVGVLKKEENEAIENFQSDVGETLELFGQIKASNKENYFFNQAVEQAKTIQMTSNEYGYKSVAYEKLSYTVFLIFFEFYNIIDAGRRAILYNLSLDGIENIALPDELTNDPLPVKGSYLLGGVL